MLSEFFSTLTSLHNNNTIIDKIGIGVGRGKVPKYLKNVCLSYITFIELKG